MVRIVRSRSSLSFENATARHAGDQTTTSRLSTSTCMEQYGTGNADGAAKCPGTVEIRLSHAFIMYMVQCETLYGTSFIRTNRIVILLKYERSSPSPKRVT
jgi:hypothetical protein